MVLVETGFVNQLQPYMVREAKRLELWVGQLVELAYAVVLSLMLSLGALQVVFLSTLFPVLKIAKQSSLI